MTYLQNQIENLIRIAQEEEKREPYYEVLESITFNKTQMFWLPVKPAPDVKIDITFKSNNTSETQCLFGGRINASGSNRKMFAFWECVGGSSSISGYMRADYGNSSTASNDIGLSSTLTDFRNFVKDGADNYIDGVKKTSNTGVLTEDDTNTYIALGCMSNGTESSYSLSNPFSGDVAQLKIWKAGTQIADYVPVLDSKMQPCLYNRITKEFLYAKVYPSGSTTTYDLGFKRWNKYDVDYIENTGTAYIPFADITPTTTMGMNIEYAYTVLSSSEPAGVIGTYNGDTQRKDTFFVSTSSGSTQKASSPSSASCGVMIFHRGGNVGTSSSSSASYIEPEKDVWYKATVNWLGDGEITWTDGINELSANVGANSVITNQLRLFSRCNSSNNTYNNCKSRVRKLQFSDGSNIIRSFKPVVWHNSDTTAIATLYDEVYNKMMTPTGSLKAYIIGYGNVFTRTGETTDKFIDANGNIQTNTNSAYSDLLPIKGGETVTCKSGTASGNNYRYHVYDSSSNWIEQGLVLNPPSAEAITGSFVAPSNASYVRVSYAKANTSDNIQVNSSLATYEVGKSVSGTPSSSALGTSNCFDTGLYGTQDTTVKHIAIAYDSDNTSGQLFGSYDGTQTTSKNLTINSTGTSGNTAPIRFDGKVITTPIRIGLNKTVSIVNSKYGLWVNDTLHGSWGSVNDFTTLTTMLILKCNNSTNTRNNGCGYCLILEKDVPIAEYIPVKNGSTIGLYDKVSKTLNTGVGTINFNALN